MNNCITTGIAGTAKNTGKTTTLSYLIKTSLEKGIKAAVTGIGYDGEEIDNITNLPKPRLLLQKDVIAATSEKCLSGKNEMFETLERTGLFTALGEILIIKVIKPDLFVIAGPNKQQDMLAIIDRIKNFNVDRIFIDGSLNRISPMYLCDEIIFTTGASRNTDINILAKEMKTIEKIFSFKKLADLSVAEIASGTKTFIKEMITIKDLDELILNKQKVVLHSPVNLLLAGSLHELSLCIFQDNVDINYLIKPDLKAVSVNPFYPEFKGMNYTAQYIDEDKLLRRMRSDLTVPVYNIKTDFPQL